MIHKINKFYLKQVLSIILIASGIGIFKNSATILIKNKHS